MKSKVQMTVLFATGFLMLATVLSEAGLFSRKADTPVPETIESAASTDNQDLTEYEKLKQAFSFFRQERDKLKEQLETEQSARQLAESQARRLQQDLDKSQTDAAILKDRLKTVSGQEMDLDQAKELDQMKRQLVAAEGKLQQARQQNAQQEADLKDAQQHVLKLRAEVGSLEKDQAALREKLKAARGAGKTEDSQHSQVLKEMAVLEQQLADTKQQLTDTRQQLVDTRQQLADTKQDLTQVRTQLAEQQIEMTQLQYQAQEASVAVVSAPASQIVEPEPTPVVAVEEVEVVSEDTGPSEAEIQKAEAYVTEGNRLLAAGRFGKARAKFERALKHDGESANAMLGMAACDYFEGDVDSASKKVETLIARYPKHVDGLGLKGIIAWRQGDEKGAMDILEMAIALDNNNAQLHNYIGIVKHAGGDLPRAADEFKKAVELEPDHVEAQFNLAVVLATSEPPRLQEAKKYYENALRLGSDRNEVLEEILYP